MGAKLGRTRKNEIGQERKWRQHLLNLLVYVLLHPLIVITLCIVLDQDIVTILT